MSLIVHGVWAVRRLSRPVLGLVFGLLSVVFGFLCMVHHIEFESSAPDKLVNWVLLAYPFFVHGLFMVVLGAFILLVTFAFYHKEKRHKTRA